MPGPILLMNQQGTAKQGPDLSCSRYPVREPAGDPTRCVGRICNRQAFVVFKRPFLARQREASDTTSEAVQNETALEGQSCYVELLVLMNPLLTAFMLAEHRRMVNDSADLAAQIITLRRVINRQRLRRLGAGSELAKPSVAELKTRVRQTVAKISGSN